MKTLQAVTGMKDILPSDSRVWQYIEKCIGASFASYGYKEIRFPVMEETRLFQRGIGETTDIVEKEMYTFEDRSGESLTLRPEGTASCVRACQQHNLLFDRGALTQKLWYSGPMFRHEKPQKGRLRQFHQFGVEAFGFEGPDIDAELLIMTARLWKTLGIDTAVTLQINSLGTPASRADHRRALVTYFRDHKDELDEDSLRRLDKNPLRIFDSKCERTQALVTHAPTLDAFLDEGSKAHFAGLREILDRAGIQYEVNPRLVRGLDYYSKTVFEWVTSRLGAQGTVCAGGRYDGLVRQLGGKETPGIGFGMGLERLILLLEALNVIPVEIYDDLDVYIVATGATYNHAVSMAEKIRDAVPNIRLSTHLGGGSFRSQMKKADRSGARIALILGEDEVEKEEVVVKYLREECDQQTIKQNDIKTILVQE